MDQVQILNRMLDKLALQIANVEKHKANLQVYVEILEAENQMLKAELEKLLPKETVKEGGE